MAFEYVLTDEKLKKYMKGSDYKKYISLKKEAKPLSISLAEKIAKAIVSWAKENGATHYTHWFFPLTSKSAEKQVAFVDIKDGKLISSFCGSSLMKGETDASSFPSEGERVTFEARGYTVWDMTSPVFIKNEGKVKVLYIPTAFIGYNGVSLDEKMPLLRANERLSDVATKLLNKLGYTDVKSVYTDLGIEQEYFLINKDLYEKRKDLILTGRTLFGSAPSKSQETYHHYFDKIDGDLRLFMNETYENLLKMGVIAKVQHNEVAPAQHEVVQRYFSTTVACDQNMLTMEELGEVAKKHGKVVLFHEKPFSGVNGSGKHNNWSISTDGGENILDVGKFDEDTFMLFFVSILSAIDKHYDLLRLSTAGAGNDQRLGGNEAPPSVISVYIGEDIENMINSYITSQKSRSKNVSAMDLKTSYLAPLIKDNCDRNRTSPFAFTGNKFEFRMLGASQSPALANCVLSTILADELLMVTKELEKGKSVKEIVKQNYEAHKRIVFNGNSYDNQWSKIASERKLVDIKDSVEAYKSLLDEKNIELFERNNVLSKREIKVRYLSYVKTYCETIITEGIVMNNILNKQIVPSLEKYLDFTQSLLKNCEKSHLDTDYLKDRAKDLNQRIIALTENSKKLQNILNSAISLNDVTLKANCCKDQLLPLYNETRNIFDEIEHSIPSEFKPFPTYDDILFD